MGISRSQSHATTASSSIASVSSTVPRAVKAIAGYRADVVPQPDQEVVNVYAPFPVLQPCSPVAGSGGLLREALRELS